MMATEFCIVRAGVSAPTRWREAFPAGTAIELPMLLVQPRGPADLARVLWLPADDGRWREQLARILRALPQDRVVVLSGSPRDDEALLALASGARGYSHAYAVPALLREVGLVVRHGGFWLGPGLLRQLVHGTGQALAVRPPQNLAPLAGCARLSAREAEVAFAVRGGCSNKEIAAQLGISERTVKAHLSAAFEKLGVRDRLQLVLRLSEIGAAAPGAGPPPLSPGSRGRPAASLPVPPSNRHASRAGLT